MFTTRGNVLSESDYSYDKTKIGGSGNITSFYVPSALYIHIYIYLYLYIDIHVAPSLYSPLILILKKNSLFVQKGNFASKVEGK